MWLVVDRSIQARDAGGAPRRWVVVPKKERNIWDARAEGYEGLSSLLLEGAPLLCERGDREVSESDLAAWIRYGLWVFHFFLTYDRS